LKKKKKGGKTGNTSHLDGMLNLRRWGKGTKGLTQNRHLKERETCTYRRTRGERREGMWKVLGGTGKWFSSDLCATVAGERRHSPRYGQKGKQGLPAAQASRPGGDNAIKLTCSTCLQPSKKRSRQQKRKRRDFIAGKGVAMNFI